MPRLFLAVLALAAGAVTSTAQEAPRHTLIPAPLAATWSPADTFWVTPSTPILAGAPEAAPAAQWLDGWIGETPDGAPEVAERDGAILFAHAGGLGEEGYRLTITPEAVTMEASGAAGFFYGAQTLRQMLAPEAEFGAAFPRARPLVGVRIEDRPRFVWRGAMLDVARHFFGVEDVKRTVDLMALYKMNRLHLHLADDQGWRIEIPGYPRLTEVGAQNEVGGGPGGFYTTEDYAEIVAYAAERHITIVPEIDMPGHTNAALVSYPELTCDGEPRKPYTGIRVGFSYLCVEKEETYRFVDAVVGHLAALTPGPYIHIGGDEVRQLSADQYAAFMARAQTIVASHGKRVLGWDEIAEVDLLPETVVQVWRPLAPEASGEGAVARAVSAGAEVVLSPADRVYLDMKWDSTAVLGLNWAGYNSVRDAYDWEPATYLADVPESVILGVEAPLWAETLTAFSDITYMALPRLAGVAELGWSAPGARGWDGYRQRLAAHGSRWTALGLTFYRAPEIDWADGP